MADIPPHLKMAGSLSGLTGSELMTLQRSPPGVNSITTDNFFGANFDQAARGDHTHGLASTDAPGFMSTADKAKLNQLLPVAQFPIGGTTGQIVYKKSDTNFHYDWGDPPAGGSGTAGWAQYNTAANLATANTVLVLGTSGYETDTKRWKLGDGVTSWVSLPYQDQPNTPGLITNPGISVTFGFRPGATQAVTYTTHPGAAVTINAPTGAPPSNHEGEMYLQIANNTASTLTIQMPGYSVIGDSLYATILAAQTILYTIWVQGGVWYVGGESDIDDGSITNAKLADVSTQTIKGRAAAGSGDVEDLTAAQARAIIDAAVPSSVPIAGNTTLAKAAHQGKLLVCSGVLSLTVDNTTGFDQHARCEISAEGGTVTIVNTATVNTATDLTIEQHKTAILRRATGANVYSLQVIG